MSDDKIVDFKSRRPVREIKEESERIKEENAKFYDEQTVEMLNALLDHAQAGTLTDFIIVARNPQTNTFFTEITFDRSVDPGKALSFTGVLEGLKLEMSDVAAMAPFFTLDGTVVDPFEEPCEEY